MGKVNSTNNISESERTDPHYIELANELRNQLIEGKFRPGQRFYTLRHLINETKRSLTTVRSAINVLINESYLEPKTGSGYYVTDKVKDLSDRPNLKLLAVIPSYISPVWEPGFTGKLVAGMIKAAESHNAIVSICQRKMFTEDGNGSEIERILDEKPSGIAWIHYADCDIPKLQQLTKVNLPVIMTKRGNPDLGLPLIREDDLLFAAIVLSHFLAHGHKRIMYITRTLDDEYFRSKVEALREYGQTIGISISDKDLFFLKGTPEACRESAQQLTEFLENRKDITGMITLASSGIASVVHLLEHTDSTRIRNLSIMHNVLDGVATPSLPTGETLAQISPPLEQIGSHLVHQLIAKIRNDAPPEVPRLIPVFTPGSSLKRIQ